MRERLSEAIVKLQTREEAIQDLTFALTESQEQLESANKDIDFYKHEKKRLKAASSFQGETHESAGQQVRAMQIERAELLKKLDAARGQTGLANEAVERVQSLLEIERKANATLRQRQELARLQEVKVAEESVKAEKQENAELQHNMYSLENTITALRDQVQTVQADVQAALTAADVERQKQDSLKDEIKVLEDKYRAEVLASVQAVAERNAAQHQAGSQTPYNDLDTSVGKNYFRPPTGRTQSDRDPAITSSPFASPSPTDVSAKATRSATASPGFENGFMTIHGRHRPDGALGGYRTDRTAQRKYSENLYESSVHNGRNGMRTLSAQTSRSEEQSTTGPDEAQPGQGWQTPAKKRGGDERVQWG